MTVQGGKRCLKRWEDDAAAGRRCRRRRLLFTRILGVSFLEPEVVKAIPRDHHPIELTAKRLANEVRLPITWDAQRALPGIG